eukprot:CAMPEP_0176036048 /NCGR_PEP_ID=MMETSP0120_2-20121206/17850_1 /TAXON_ID=160619 /ORGANISM="Kryptoperidinium foliaceum, Strain CCMP 1326" /LENGTH=72 /DNA_ID=CAMNT_0017369433 /DNA_START=102 /DNA_END=316 /DNA_ORIENTATION=-
MVFGLFDQQKSKKLDEERQQQQALIEAQLAELQMEHELQSHTLQQKGLIQQQQRLTEKQKKESEQQKKQNNG